MSQHSEEPEDRLPESPESTPPDLLARNVDEIIELENAELARTTRAQRWSEAVSRRLARPAYPICLLIFTVAWVALNLGARLLGIRPFDPPPFPWLDGLLTLTALLTTSVVLIAQARQSVVAEQRAHLDLQINLLTEHKVAKLIHLVEELRMDLPGVKTRHDPHVSQLKRPASPGQVASALKQRDAASEESPQDSS
jgi:uncharacterized membrane protein